MSKVTLKSFCTSAGIFILTLQPLCADTLLSGRGDTVVTSTSTANVGYSFTVGSSPLLVTALGIWDSRESGRNRFAHPQEVSLWTASGTLLGEVTVAARAGGPRDGGFRYTPLSASLTLTPGQTYVLDADYATSRDRFRIVSLGQVATLLSSSVTFDSSLEGGQETGFPSQDYSAGVLVGPNLEYTVVPEPSSTSVATIGAIMVLVACWPVLARRKNMTLSGVILATSNL